MTNSKQRRLTVAVTGVICVVIVTVLLYAIQYPEKFKEITSPQIAFDSERDFVKFIDVGQADSTLICSNGYSAMIDLGLANTTNEIRVALNDCNVKRINTVLISHLHADHVGGLPNIAEDLKIENLIMPKLFEGSIISAQNGRIIATKNGTAYYDAKQGMNFDIGDFEITLLSDFQDTKDENNRSVFVMAEIRDKKFLFTGDATEKSEALLLNEKLNLDCDVLKVAHHGSKDSTSDAFLKATTPEYAVISVGKENQYSHPNQETLSALKEAGATIYRTDVSGDITFHINENNIYVNKEK